MKLIGWNLFIKVKGKTIIYLKKWFELQMYDEITIASVAFMIKINLISKTLDNRKLWKKFFSIFYIQIQWIKAESRDIVYRFFACIFFTFYG